MIIEAILATSISGEFRLLKYFGMVGDTMKKKTGFEFIKGTFVESKIITRPEEVVYIGEVDKNWLPDNLLADKELLEVSYKKLEENPSSLVNVCFVEV